MKLVWILVFLSFLLNPGCRSAPQDSAGVSGKLVWWKGDSFNTATNSQYMYSSFREKVFEPLMDRILAELKALKKEQTVNDDLTYGSLAAGVCAILGLAFILFKMKLARKANEGSKDNNRETSRVF